MDLKGCLKDIVDKMPKGSYFDSHTVICELMRIPEYHAVYLKEYATTYSNCTVAQYHAQIAQLIPKVLQGIAPVGNSMSHTIYGDIAENQLWQKQ